MTAASPIILLPTYNERENLERVISAILVVQPKFCIAVIDDASPDGTGELADSIAARDSRIRVLHRPGKQGLARAYLDAMRWALAQSDHFTHFFEMDADLAIARMTWQGSTKPVQRKEGICQ